MQISTVKEELILRSKDLTMETSTDEYVTVGLICGIDLKLKILSSVNNVEYGRVCLELVFHRFHWM